MKTKTKTRTERAVVYKARTGYFWVGVAGFEPTASSSRTKRATKLRHTPLKAPTAYRTAPPADQIAGSRINVSSLPGAGALEFQ